MVTESAAGAAQVVAPVSQMIVIVCPAVIVAGDVNWNVYSCVVVPAAAVL
jgi:hypothetical protein